MEIRTPKSDTKPDTYSTVSEYYAKVLSTSDDLKTSACCPTDGVSPEHREILSMIDDEVLEKFYGCGSPIPPMLEGTTVLDLGCGSGRDVYLASHLVGEGGFVVGVDMTEEQLAVARRHVDEQTRRFGYARANVDFRQGYIEDLAAAGVEDNSVDVVISNCVINLSPNKHAVFSEIYRVLKPGGELFFADVFSGRRVPDVLRQDPVLYGECLAGAMYTEDFRRTMAAVGFVDHRVVSSSRITIEDPELNERAGMIDFYSKTIRAFKLETLEDTCEDYGQIATYRGTVPGHPHRFELDDHHEFITGKPMLVCGNTAAMVQETRYERHFRVVGDRRTHYGLFDCAPASAKTESGESSSGGACC